MSYLIFTIKLSVLLGLISCNEGHVFLITWCLGPNELVKSPRLCCAMCLLTAKVGNDSIFL